MYAVDKSLHPPEPPGPTHLHAYHIVTAMVLESNGYGVIK
jgi:hypothetical protein